MPKEPKPPFMGMSAAKANRLGGGGKAKRIKLTFTPEERAKSTRCYHNEKSWTSRNCTGSLPPFWTYTKGSDGKTVRRTASLNEVKAWRRKFKDGF